MDRVKPIHMLIKSSWLDYRFPLKGSTDLKKTDRKNCPAFPVLK